MKRSCALQLIAFFTIGFVFSQELALRKGRVIDTIPLNNSLNESFSLYLPRAFKNKEEWPILFVFDVDDDAEKAIEKYKDVAESENYILASSNNISDTISISNNVLIAGRMFAKIDSILPVHRNQIYTAGHGSSGRLASLMPIFFKNIDGVVISGAALANTELLSSKKPFHFIGIIGKENFNYTTLLAQEKFLNNFKYPNNLLVSDVGNVWPSKNELKRALQLFRLSAMAKDYIAKDATYIDNAYISDLKVIASLKENKKLLLADRALREMQTVYRTHRNVDSLKQLIKALKKDKLYRSLKRNENATFFKEKFLKEDYSYYLEEDLDTYNYNNLGWWNYQMEELDKFIYGDSDSEMQMGKRLKAYVNALIEDYIESVNSDKEVDDEALILLSMLKTITQPNNYEHYLNVISLSSKYEDYGTALFYLEEALKKGFKNKDRLNVLKHTSTLRATPEYTELIDKY